MAKAKKQAPVGVKIISVYYYAVFVFSAVIGLLAIFGASFIYNFIVNVMNAQVPGNPTIELSKFAPLIIIFIGIIFIISAIVSFFIGRGLWTGKNFARIVAVAFSIIAIVSNLTSILSGTFIGRSIIGLLIDGLIVWYLLTNKDVKKFFS